MKTFYVLSLLTMCLFFIVSCDRKPNENYVNTSVYSISTVIYIPDSLKSQYREWVKETVRAASQNMTGGDYEDADETIAQCELSGERIFGTKTACLCIRYADYQYREVIPSKMTDEEKVIFNKLLNNLKRQ